MSELTVNVSPLTDRVDNLQSSVTQLRQELVQIRQTIPVNLPEFTEPVPVNISGGMNIDLSGIAAQLTEIKQVLEAGLAPTPPPFSTPPMLEEISLSSVELSTNVWANITPSDLGAIVDGNPDTATTWGRIIGTADQGWMQADFGTPNRLYIEVTFGIRMAESSSSGNTGFFIQTGNNSDVLLNIIEDRILPTGIEQVFTVPAWINSRYLRIGLLGTGSGQPEMRVYQIKAWGINFP